MRYLRLLVLALGLSLPTSVAAAQARAAVAVQDDMFNPVQTQTSNGATLTWTNAGAEQHTITADDGSFDSGMIDSGQTFSFTFAEPGTYPYYCQIHGAPGGEGMAGTIVVGG